MSANVNDWKARRMRLLVGGIPQRPRELLKSAVVLGALRELGWQRSSRERRSVDHEGTPMPWLTYPALDWLAGRAHRLASVVEFGAGASTLWFLANGAKVTSIEHDDAWVQELRPTLPDGCELVQVPADEAGYVRGVDRAGLGAFDLALVDGLHRGACVRAVLPHLKPSSLLCLDDSQRPAYAAIIDELHRDGFRSIGFRGLAPIVAEVKETRFFSRSLDEWMDPA